MIFRKYFKQVNKENYKGFVKDFMIMNNYR